ncbi:hypothetical protein AURDEDRAFT_90068 [Auricularia subglabra TFB-10046 SS5]|nr:hypothetical protein AURDEDRAFT_90068 [Auricularia subglabra TFB-10046 SS5]
MLQPPCARVPESPNPIEPEDILADALSSLIGQEERVWHSAPGAFYTHPGTGIVVSPPDTQAKNWALHASAVWAASIFLADHLDELGVCDAPAGTRVLELGAGAGLPGIAIAKLAPQTQVHLTDYPDTLILDRLVDNVRLNSVERNCHVHGLSWGSQSLVPHHGRHDHAPGDVLRFPGTPGFDLILAADTLWNPESQPLLCDTLCRFLRRPCSLSDSRAVLVAGMHTGRYALQKFLVLAQAAGLEICNLRERRIHETSEAGQNERSWATERPNEDEAARRQWVLWLVLKHRRD